MCRYACKDPTTCKIARFTVSPVKGFVRNQSVQFFSPPSDTDSDDDEFPDEAPFFASSKSAAFSRPSIAATAEGNDDSGPFAAAPSSSAVDPTDFLEFSSVDSGLGSEQSTAIDLKSILTKPTVETTPKCSAERKRLRFADDCGLPLEQCRHIPNRRVDALFADLVEIGPISGEEEASPWRVALLRKMYALSSSSNNGNQLPALAQQQEQNVNQRVGQQSPAKNNQRG